MEVSYCHKKTHRNSWIPLENGQANSGKRLTEKEYLLYVCFAPITTEQIGHIFAILSSCLAKIVTCCKELCLAMKVGVFNSILKRSDKTLNVVKQIISYRKKSSSSNLLSSQCCSLLSMLPELYARSLFLQALY
jgi:hypothetical protein